MISYSQPISVVVSVLQCCHEWMVGEGIHQRWHLCWWEHVLLLDPTVSMPWYLPHSQSWHIWWCVTQGGVVWPWEHAHMLWNQRLWSDWQKVCRHAKIQKESDEGGRRWERSCGLVTWWSQGPVTELLSPMAVISEGLGFNLCVAPFLNVCVLNLSRRVRAKLLEVVRVGSEVLYWSRMEGD